MVDFSQRDLAATSVSSCPKLVAVATSVLPFSVGQNRIYENVEFPTVPKTIGELKLNSPTQISANISAETRELLERYVTIHGVKKSHLIETAVLHHLSALDSIPADLIIPPMIEVSSDTGSSILERIENPKPPTDAMKALFGG